MRIVLKMSLLSSLLVPLMSNAVSLDYRHEYKQNSGTNADRLKLSHTTKEGYFFSVEGKVSESTTRQSDGFNEGKGQFSGSGSEWEAGKNFRISDSLTIAPGINLDIGDNFIGYRAQVKAIYKFTDNWLTTFRWRPGIEVNENSAVKNKKYNQFNWEVGFVNRDFYVTGDFEYRFTDYDDYNGNHNYWLYNVTAGYNIDKNWTPYTEIGIVPRYNKDHDQDEMEMRYRLGVKYNF